MVTRKDLLSSCGSWGLSVGSELTHVYPRIGWGLANPSSSWTGSDVVWEGICGQESGGLGT